MRHCLRHHEADAIPVFAGARAAVLVLALAGLCGCATQEPGLPAAAADSPVKNLAKATNFATDVPEPKDFVVKSRASAATNDYIPVHERPPARPEKVLTPAGVAAERKALEAVAANHDRISGRPVTPVKTTAKPKRTSPEAAPAAN